MERYESLGLVGEGSYGTVLKCRHRDSGRLVAIKKFMDSDDDKTVKKIALREIKLLRQLRHDNLVNLLEVWKRRRRWYLVFEFVERTLLEDLEQNPSGLDLNTSRQYLYQILRAAAFCHQQHIIHRDIKPENILISQGGVVKMCDFGFARTMTSPAEGGVYTDYVATRWYRAPELLVGDTKYGKPVDVWAVGCLLLEMLTGQPLFPGDSDLDQIYHIVRYFGDLTAHHQELFYRNPVFSGVRLPENSVRVRLEQRFPTVTPTALDLAQSCLQMDPDRRAQCSELLEHPLFTQDSFHVRFLDELNAKIQKDHRDNSTLPKISKNPRRERNEGDDKNWRSKDKKQAEDVNEKVNKERERKEDEKMEKTKGKQHSKLSKTVRNASEPLISKQSKTFGAKIIDNAAKMTVAMKSKPGKATGVDLRKEREISKSTKTRKSDFLETTTTATHLKENNTVVPKPKHGKVASQETREDHLKTTDTKDGDSSGLNSSCSDSIVPNVTEKTLMEIWRSSKSEPSQEFGKSWNNSNTKVPNLSKSSTTDHPNGTSSPKASLNSTIDRTDTHLTQKMGKSSTTEYPEGPSTVATSKIANIGQVETSLTLKAPQPSSNDHIKVATPTNPSVTKPCERLMTLEHQGNRSMDTEQKKASECPKGLPSSPKTAKNNTSLFISPLKTLTSDLSRQSSTILIEASPAISTATPPKGSLNSKLSKTGSSSDPKPKHDTTCVPNKPSRGLPTDRKPTEVLIASSNQQDVIEDRGCLKISPAANLIDVSDASGGEYKENPDSSELCRIHQQSTSESKITTESRITSASMPNEIPKANTSAGTNFPKTQKASDKENREDLALSVSVSATTKSLVNQMSEVSRSSSFEQKNSSESDVKSQKPPHFFIIEPKTQLGSFSNKSVATMTLRTKKTTFPTEARRKRDNADTDDTTNTYTFADSTSFASTTTPDHKALTRSLVFPDEFAFGVPHSSPHPPPPPSSTPVIPSFSVVSPAASDHRSQGAGFHPGAHSVRCVDKPRHHGGIYSRLSNHITGSLTAQVSEKNLICERSFPCDHCNLGTSGGITATKKKSDIHFPDLRSSVLPELRGREGKHNKGTSKDKRKEKPAPPSPSDTQRPKQKPLSDFTLM
ncbi:cyclin-dependent kinase-like 5 [Sander lucioperca]|uniref:cyclin-dependent kinase-like 5 n=1 Tax=Sander lucioperca TaxID=283035 RepID=UPI00125DC8D9|nr:cyclin-dependent kinase-like 5 [Sander lucioperca]